jgi:hypothetical protein
MLLSRLVRLSPFAHHPSCSYWSNHLIHLGRYPICLGCFCMSVGMALGVLMLLVGVFSSFAPWERFLLGFAAYTPTLIQIYRQRYVFKIAARFLLGVGTALAVSSSISGYPWDNVYAIVNLGFLSVFILLFVGTSRWRSRHLDVPCLRCPEGRFPFCSWRHPNIVAALRQHEAGFATLPSETASFLYAVDRSLSGSKQSSAQHTIVLVNMHHSYRVRR